MWNGIPLVGSQRRLSLAPLPGDDYSTYPAWKVMEALMVSEQKSYARYITEQPPYNLLDAAA